MNWVQFLSDPNGDVSSKRLIGLVAFAAFLAFATAETFFGYHPSEHTMNDLMLIIGAGVLGATIDHFAERRE